MKKTHLPPSISRYLGAVRRRLVLPRATRDKILLDLELDVNARLEAGESPDAILAGLGPAAALAASFNKELGAAGRPSRWRWLFLALGVVTLARLLGQIVAVVGMSGLVASGTSGVIGGADGPTAVFVTGNAFPMAYGGVPLVGLLFLCAGAFLLLRSRAAYRAAALCAAASLGCWVFRVLAGVYTLVSFVPGAGAEAVASFLAGSILGSLRLPAFWGALILLFAAWRARKAAG